MSRVVALIEASFGYRWSHFAALAAGAGEAVADNPAHITTEVGYAGSNADWHDAHVMGHATDDPTRARLWVAGRQRRAA